MIGAIAFANFGKEARETFVQLFTFVFDNVVVEALALKPLLSANDFQTFIHVLVVLNVFWFTPENLERGGRVPLTLLPSPPPFPPPPPK